MIYIFDKKQAIIKVLTNDDFTAAHLNFKINTATTFEFSLPASKALPSGSKYVATPHPLNDSKFIMLRLTERVDNTETIDYSAYELAYQELATDGYIEDKRPHNQSALNLMKIALNGSNWELNNVNVSGTATTNFYYVDHLSAISKVVDLLGGEIVFYIEIQGNTVSGRYMDYLARQEADTSKVFASGSNLLTVERQSDTSNIYTAILPRGKGEEIDNGKSDTPDGYGRRINIADVEWKKSAGNPLDKPKGSIVLSDPDATAEWGQINGNARLLLQTYDDIDDVNVLINSAYKTLQSVNHPQIQYSATVADVGGLSLGDTVLIMHGDRDLSYKTRVFEVKYDLLSPDQTELSLGDDLSSNSITSHINNLNAVADTTSSQTQWTINQIGRPGTTYGATAPDSPKVGDIWFKYLADGGTEIHRWNGNIWELLASPTTADDIAKAVDDAFTKAKAHTDEVKQGLINDIETAKSQAASLASTAEANAKSEATSLFSQAQNALSAAKTDLTTSINKEVTDRTKAVSALDTKAQGYADTAKTDAINAATTADGVINKKIDDTASSITSTISQNKVDADGKITTAQSTATQALNGLATKVSQTVYDAKTGQLQTDLNTTTATANTSKQDIVAIKSDNTKQDARMTTIESDANGTKTTVSNLQTDLGKANGSISTLQQRADGFDVTVSKVKNLSVGGRNYVLNSNGFGDNNSKPFLIGSSADWWGPAVSFPSDGVLLTNPKTHTSGEWFYGIASAFTPFANTPLTPGNAFSFSAEVMGTVPQVALRWGFNGTKGIETFKTFDINNTSWTRVSIVAQSQPTNTGLYFRIQGASGGQYNATWAGGETLKFRNVKIEDGNLPSGWTPAPEDVDSATAKAQLTADNASLAVTKLTSADGIITKAQADIKANANAITQKVSQSDYNAKTGQIDGQISTINQTAGQISQSVSNVKAQVDGLSVGGRNLITGTASDTVLVAGTNVNKYATIYSNIQTGVPYTFSTEITLANSTDNQVRVAVYNTNYQTAYLINDSFKVDGTRNSWTFTVPSTVAGPALLLIYAGPFQKTTGITATYHHIKLEQGNLPTDWTPAPEDVDSTIAKVKITADNISNFVRDSSGNISTDFQTALSKTSIIAGSALASSIQKQTATQISSALTDNNGKIISLINQDASGVQIAGKNIVLDGNTTVTGDFYAKGGNFKNLNASNLTVGTLNGNQVNITNINANNIVSGAISGANLNINLNTGSVVFQKGRINSSDYTTDINIDKGYISTANDDTRAILKNGQLQLTSPNYYDLQTNPYLAIYNDPRAFDSTGKFNSAIISARDRVIIGNKDGINDMIWFGDTFYFGQSRFYGLSSGTTIGNKIPTIVGGGETGVVLVGGSTYTNVIGGNDSPSITVGWSPDNIYSGNRVMIQGDRVHIPSIYNRTWSVSSNVYVAADGSLYRASSARKYKLDIKNNIPIADSLKLIDVPLSTWIDKREHEENGSNERYFGMIAEDLRDAGLEYLVQYGEDNEVEGINYDRVALLLIPLVKELKERIEELESEGK